MPKTSGRSVLGGVTGIRRRPVVPRVNKWFALAGTIGREPGIRSCVGGGCIGGGPGVRSSIANGIVAWDAHVGTERAIGCHIRRRGIVNRWRKAGIAKATHQSTTHRARAIAGADVAPVGRGKAHAGTIGLAGIGTRLLPGRQAFLPAAGRARDQREDHKNRPRASSHASSPWQKAYHGPAPIFLGHESTNVSFLRKSR